MGQNVWYGLYILSLVLSFELLSATTSELCIQPPSPSDTSASCACQSCGFATSQAHKLCVKGDIICIPANYSKFELPNLNSATEVRHKFSYNKYPISDKLTLRIRNICIIQIFTIRERKIIDLFLKFR